MMSQVSFAVGKRDRALIDKIVARALRLYEEIEVEVPDRLTLTMDLTAAHCSNPLRLADLLVADNFNFTHDVAGIHRHMDRSTGELTDHFSPRFTR